MTPSFGRLALLVTASLTFAGPLQAQTAKPSAEQLKSWIATRQQRVDLLKEEFKQTDERIESRLDIIIDTLTAIADSKDSRTKVARMKEDTMKRLMKTVQYYDQKRAAIRQEMRNPQMRLTEEEKKKI